MTAFFSRKPAAELRLFFTTDVHGSERCFRKFLNAAQVHKADVLVLGGDVTGKRIVPLVAERDGVHGTLDGRVHVLKDEASVAEFERSAADQGLYAWHTNADGVSMLNEDPEAVEKVFLQLAGERLSRWLALAAERLDPSKVRLFINLGNDDPFELNHIIETSQFVYPEGRLVELDGRRAMASVGFANLTPWHCARDVSEDELARRIREAVESGSLDRRQLVMNLHCPPFNSGLDTAALLDGDLNPVMQAGQPELGPVGSTAVREAIERYQPILSLHGHIHESRGVAKINRTVAINPGSEYPEGILRGTLITFDREGLAGYVLTSG